MLSSGEIPTTKARRTGAQWSAISLVGLLIAGLSGAAWQMAHRGMPQGPRDLTVLAPSGVEVRVDSQPSRIPVSKGVHAFSVTPGAHQLEVVTQTGDTLSRSLEIPLGVGPLMIETMPQADGSIQVGVY